MAKQYPINWKRGDFSVLGKAISKFNREIEKLAFINPEANLPEKLSYKDVKENIYTRKEYNRMIKSLQKMSNPRQQELVKTRGGYTLTRWQRDEINKAKRRAIKRLTEEKETLELKSSILGMGSNKLNEINATLESLGRLSNAKPEDFERISRRALTQGVSDYDMKKATIFQKNFITAYEKMGKDRLVEIARSYKNPLDFWEFIKDSNFTDIKMKYDEHDGLIQFGESTEDENYIYDLLRLVDKEE